MGMEGWKQRSLRTLYPREPRASLWICKHPTASWRQITALLFLSGAGPPLMLSLIDETETLLGLFDTNDQSCSQALFSPSSPTKQKNSTYFPIRSSSNTTSSTKSIPRITPWFAFSAWVSHPLWVWYQVCLVSQSCVSYTRLSDPWGQHCSFPTLASPLTTNRA